MRRNFAILMVVMAALIIGGAVMYIVLSYFPITKTVITESNFIITETSLNKSIAKVYEASVTVEAFKNGILIGTGSGFVYKKDAVSGYILTNCHVVEGATTFEITFSDESVVMGELLGSNEKLDLAVLSISQNQVLKVATLGNSNNVKIGDLVFTVGTPVDAKYGGTVTKGIVSKEARYLDLETSNKEEIIMKTIQTDAAINGGNSGGPLVNVAGEVIGVNALKLGNVDTVEGIAFSIPINDVLVHINKLEQGIKIEFPNLDLSYVNLTDSKTINKLGLTSDGKVNVGVMVTAVGSSISTIKKGNIIIAFNDIEIKSVNYLKYLLTHYEIGDKVTLRYYNGDIIKNGDFILK